MAGDLIYFVTQNQMHKVGILLKKTLAKLIELEEAYNLM